MRLERRVPNFEPLVMNPSSLTFRTLAAMSLALALSACGSGGGGTDLPAQRTPETAATVPVTGDPTSPGGGGTGTGSTDPTVPSGGTLQVNVPDPTYGAGSVAISAFDALNAARRGAGAGPLVQSTQLDTAAAAHSRYLTTNLGAVGGLTHIEDPARADFDAATPVARMLKAGYPVGRWNELIGSTGVSRQGADCVRNQLNAVYHAAALLRNVTDVGFGFGTDTQGYPLCVITLASRENATPQVPASGAIVAYPYDGQTNVLETFLLGLEVPRAPLVLFPNITAGTPVIVSVRNADYVNLQNAGTLAATITQFTLKDAGGNTVSAGILGAVGLGAGSGVALTSDANLLEGYVSLVPFSPLTKGVTYQVTFAATLGPGAAPLSKTWSFTTNP